MFAVLLCIAALCVLAPAALAVQPLDESENASRIPTQNNCACCKI